MTANHSISGNLPVIKSAQFGEWRVSFYNDFKSNFLNNKNELHEEVRSVISGFIKEVSLPRYYCQVQICSVPFLMSIFEDTKEVRFYTAKLSSEIFYLSTIEDDSSKELNTYKEFKEYVEQVASLDRSLFPSVIERVTKQEGLVDLFNDEDYDFSTTSTVKELLGKVNEYGPSLFERVSDYGLGLTAQYALLRVHLLKFIAILPSLDHDKGPEVKRILLESLRRLLSDCADARRKEVTDQYKSLPNGLIFIFIFISIISKLIPANLLAWIVRSKIRWMAKRFIAGESIEKAQKALTSLFETDRDVTLDQLGELVVSEKEADNYCREVLKLIRGFSLHVKKGERNKAGINKAHVSIKVSALCSDFKAYAPNYTYEHVAPRLREILLCAKENEVFINIDAEHYDYRDIVFKVYKRVLLETAELKDFADTGIVIQAYLRDGASHLKEVVELAKERGLIMPVRLVKGAYWDAETVEADAHSFDAPEFLNKEETDLHFRQLIIEIFKAHPHLQICLASHNFSDHSFAYDLRAKSFQQIPPIEHQCLHMTYEALSTGMAKMGWVVRNYVPVGSLLVGMAYLVRRIMENSSQVGVLTIMRSHKIEGRLKSAAEIHIDKKKSSALKLDQTIELLDGKFFNVSPVRMYLDSERYWVNQALTRYQEKMGRYFENSFNLFSSLDKSKRVEIFSPSEKDTLVGSIDFANLEDAKRAIKVLDQDYNSGAWSKRSPFERAKTLIRASHITLSRRNELCSLIMHEAGKSVSEALADIDEAIDFLNFYAREALSISDQYHSRGVVGVIAPWNFPFAIPCGMVVSSLVAGNTVVLKSAEQTPLIAAQLVEILHQSGVPIDSLIHLPGEGEIVGAQIVSNERVSAIVFTGSKDVGMRIYAKASKRIYKNELYETQYPVKVITEMGGKNAIIVTANAELDETVSGILYSSFAHAGQKCSAGSRVIVDNSIKRKLVERLRQACLDMEVGKATDFKVAINPVVNISEKERLKRQVAEACDEAQSYGGEVIVQRASEEELPGACVGPTIIELPLHQAVKSESFARRELFGPVVHIIGVDGLDQSIEVFNSTEYALTGGIFSQSQDDIDYVTAKMECGNIYVNRSITGARVAVEPFGGFKLSGTGPKAGSRDYLKSFFIKSGEGFREPMKVDDDQFEQESDYDFDLCSRSDEQLNLRIKKSIDASNSLIRNFDNLYAGLEFSKKQAIEQFNSWLMNSAVSFFSTSEDNRVIPGQLSYNRYDLRAERGVLVTDKAAPEIETLVWAISCLSVGSGLTIICRSDTAYSWWSRFLQNYRSAGFNKNNVDLYFPSKTTLGKKLKQADLSFVIIDCSDDLKDHVKDIVLSNIQNCERVTKLLDPCDSHLSSHIESFIKDFTWTRSYAVNIMRHGAPMDV